MCKKASDTIADYLQFKGKKQETFDKFVAPGTDWVKDIGSMFTAALFVNLACILSNRTKSLVAQLNDFPRRNPRFLMYAYGSGAMGTVYLLKLIKSPERRISIPWAHEKRQQITVPGWITNGYFAPNLNSMPPDKKSDAEQKEVTSPTSSPDSESRFTFVRTSSIKGVNQYSFSDLD